MLKDIASIIISTCGYHRLLRFVGSRHLFDGIFKNLEKQNRARFFRKITGGLVLLVVYTEHRRLHVKCLTRFM